jgi:hypothetical protein
MGACYSHTKKRDFEPKVIEEKPRKSVELKDVKQSNLMKRRKSDGSNPNLSTNNKIEEPMNKKDRA